MSQLNRHTTVSQPRPTIRGRQGSGSARKSCPTKTFRIQNGRVILCPSNNRAQAAWEKQNTFSNEGDLARLSADWPSARLVEMWNRLPEAKPVRRFTDRKTAVRRIWRAIQNLKIVSRRPALSEKLNSAGSERADRPRSPGQPASKSTKADRITALLKRAEGATLVALMAATGWQAHSVRGFISGQLRKRMHLDVKSFVLEGQRVYTLKSQTASPSILNKKRTAK